MDQLNVDNIIDLRNWLKANHRNRESIWLVRWKKDSGGPYIPYSDIVDELFCFGWIDSLPRKLDEKRSLLLISPRKPTSNWSALNKRKVEKLLKDGQMEEAGLQAVALAKANGAWSFLDDVELLVIPPDLKAMLEQFPGASEFFERFPPSSKRGILEWIKNARTPATREKRIRETAEKAANNTKANHPKGRDKGPALQLGTGYLCKYSRNLCNHPTVQATTFVLISQGEMNEQIIRIRSISELHEALGIDKPKHPLISIINADQLHVAEEHIGKKVIYDFYMVSLKDKNCGVDYGRHSFDFSGGVLQPKR